MTITISSAFDAGSIEVISITPQSALASAVPTVDIRLRLRPDNASDYKQWFHFRLQGAAGVRCLIRIEELADSAYPEGWPGYRMVASHDRSHWFRLPGTSHEHGQLLIDWTPEHDLAFLAYFEPYSWERHQDLVARVAASGRARVHAIGKSLDGRDIDLVTVGEPAPRKKLLWVIARQHPGETMAEWFVEGMLERLLGDDPVARALLERAVVHVVPNMNPDGSVRGNLRTNAAGANLNREWMNPSAERSPEVLCVREQMHRLGVDFCLDVHGDESLPYVFIDGSHMLPGRSIANIERERAFIEAVRRACPDFQTEHGYAFDRFTDELHTLASKYVAHTFDCLSVTLEMPFKDNANWPDVTTGWSAGRSKALGAQMLDAIIEDVRAR